MKKSLYLLLAILPLFTSCELYMDLEDEPTKPAINPYENVVKEENKNGLVCEYQYNEGTKELTEEYDQYIVANEGDSVLYFREDTPVGFTPKVDECLVSKFREKFRRGLCRKVTAVEKQNGMFKVSMERAMIDDAYKVLRFDATNAAYPLYVIRDEVTAQQEDSILQMVTRSGLTRTNFELNSQDPGLQIINKVWEYTPTYEELAPTEGATKLKFQHTVNAKYDLAFLYGKSLDDDKNKEISLSGSFAMDSYVYTDGVDKTDVTGGSCTFKKITVDKYHLDCTINKSLSKSFRPLKKLADQMLEKTMNCLGYSFGLIAYPDIIITLKLEGEGGFSFDWVVANEIEVEVDNFGHKKEKTKRLKGQYGDGIHPSPSSDVYAQLTGSVDLTVDLTVGVTALEAAVEIGPFIQGGITASLTIGSKVSENCRDLEIPELEKEITANRDEGVRLNAHWGAGVHLRAGLPRFMTVDQFNDKINAGKTDFEEREDNMLMKKWTKYFNIDLDWVTMEFADNAFTLRLDIAKKILGQTNKDFAEVPFFPTLSTRKSSIVCTNFDDTTKDKCKFKGKIQFSNGGTADFHDLRLLVLDRHDKYITTIPWKDENEIIVGDKMYEFDFELPAKSSVDDLLIEEYHIFPIYKISTGGECSNMEFTVKTYTPSIAMQTLDQRYFYDERNPETKKMEYEYSVRGTAVINGHSDIKNWGFIVKYTTNTRLKPSPDYSISKFFRTIGSVELDPSSDNFKNASRKTTFELDFTSIDKSMNGYYIYLIPYYKPLDGDQVILWDSYKDVRIYDSELVNDNYDPEETPDMKLIMN